MTNWIHLCLWLMLILVCYFIVHYIRYFTLLYTHATMLPYTHHHSSRLPRCRRMHVGWLSCTHAGCLADKASDTVQVVCSSTNRGVPSTQPQGRKTERTNPTLDGYQEQINRSDYDDSAAQVGNHQCKSTSLRARSYGHKSDRLVLKAQV